MGAIIVGQNRYSFEKIHAGSWKGLDVAFENAFEFCRAWLRGQGKFVMRTSGSTGKPQEITINREQMEASAKATKKFFGLRKGGMLLCCLNTDLIAGRMMLVRAMEWQADLRLVPPSSLPLHNLEESGYDFAAMVPLQLQASLADKGALDILNNIGILIVGGAALSLDLQKKAKSLKGKVYQTYGMTETVSHVALADLKSAGPLTYGALPGVKLSVDDGSRLIIQAPMSGNRKLHTQDVVELLDRTHFVWKGRVDFVINSGGVKLHPEELEEVFMPLMQAHFPERRYFFTGRKDEQFGEVLVLVIEGKADAIKITGLMEMASKELGKYQLPKQVLFAKKFVMTPSEKINRLETVKTLL